MKAYFFIARLSVVLTLFIAWGLTDSPLLGVALILLLVGLAAVRYHSGPYTWCAAAEIAVCALCALYWRGALPGLWLPVLAMLEKKWSERESELLQNEYNNRTELLELKRTRESTETQMRRIAHLTELSERARIAQDIHDHVGHEISGTLIALRTALVLYEKQDGRAGELLAQAAARLESASAGLRETVHNLKPERGAGVDTPEALCQAFTFCKVDFTANGQVDNPETNEILSANLKEALTNISRHANATAVSVKLDVNERYIRLVIRDNGTAVQEPKTGMGLAGMRERMHRAGGHMTVNTDDGFKIVCVLPRQKDVMHHQAFDC